MEQKDKSFEEAQRRWSEANAPQLIRNRINTGNLSDPLYLNRMDAIEQALGLRPVFASDEEDSILSDMKGQLQQLSQALGRQSDFATEIEPCCKRLLKGLHAYVFFRMEAVLTNLSPNNAHYYPKGKTKSVVLYTHPVVGEYQIYQKFTDYCSEVLQSVETFKSSEKFKTIVNLLRRHAPLLLTKPLTLTEFFTTTRSALCCPQTKFFSPPYLEELCEIALAVNSILSTQGQINIPATQRILNVLADRLVRQERLESISVLLSKVIGTVEALSYVTPQQISTQTEPFIRQCFFMGLALSEYFSYDLMFVSPSTVAKAQKTLVNQSSSVDQKIMATRQIIHSQMPWYLLRNFGLLQFYTGTTKLNRPQMLKIQFDSIASFSADYQKLLPALKFLLHFEIEATKGNVIELPVQPLMPSPLPTLSLFGNYGADMVFSLKMRDTLASLKLDRPLEPNALLRIFGILGECGKNVSADFMRMTGNDFWASVRNLRDFIAHKKSVELKVVGILEQDHGLRMQVQADLENLCGVVDAFLNTDPADIAEIRKLYVGVAHPMLAVETLYNRACMRLLPADKQALLDTASLQPTDLEVKRDLVVSILTGSVQANQVEQDKFSAMLNSLYTLSKTLRKKILEHYKGLRAGKITKLPTECLATLQSIQTEPKDIYRQKVSELIERLPEFITPASLKAALEAIGLTSANALWEQKRLQCVVRLPAQDFAEDQKSPFELAESATNGLLFHLDKLDVLTRIYRGDLTLFWANPNICLAAEHHFVMIRQYGQDIQEAMALIENFQTVDPRQVALNTLCQLIDESLYSLRLYGNSLAHLHDMIDFNTMTMTPHGNRLLLWQRIVAGLDGTQLKSGENPIILTSLRVNINAALVELKKRIQLADPQTNNPLRFHQPAVPAVPVVPTVDSKFVSTSLNSTLGPC